MKLLASALLAGLAALPAHAINKCTGPDGKIVYQDAPCAGKGEAITVRPASGTAPVATAPAGTNAQPAAAVGGGRKEGAFGESWQRRTYLENRGVPDARASLEAHKQACERKIRALEASKANANNNLAGATYMQSLSTQMQAEATMCDMRARELSADLQAKEAELKKLRVDHR